MIGSAEVLDGNSKGYLSTNRDGGQVGCNAADAHIMLWEYHDSETPTLRYIVRICRLGGDDVLSLHSIACGEGSARARWV